MLCSLPGLNHLHGRSIDVALVEGDLEVVPRLGYLNRDSHLSLFWLAAALSISLSVFFLLLEDTGSLSDLFLFFRSPPSPSMTCV